MSKYKKGQQVVSIEGEQDDGPDDKVRGTGPNALGEIVAGRETRGPQGWIYCVLFEPSGVWVFLDEAQLDDKDKYVVLEAVAS